MPRVRSTLSHCKAHSHDWKSPHKIVCVRRLQSLGHCIQRVCVSKLRSLGHCVQFVCVRRLRSLGHCVQFVCVRRLRSLGHCIQFVCVRRLRFPGHCIQFVPERTLAAAARNLGRLTIMAPVMEFSKTRYYRPCVCSMTIKRRRRASRPL